MSYHRPKIVVLSERAIFRECLVCFFERNGFRGVVGAASIRALSQRLRGKTPDVVLIDLVEKSGDPQKAVQGLRGRWPEAAVVALGTPLQLGANARDANGCIELCKAHASDVAAMANALEGPRARRLSFAVSPETEGQRRRWGAVTDREREVLDILSSGADNLKMAAVLGVSERTIKAHITHLFKKLGTENRTELALLAYRAGLHDSKEPARHAG
jgi:two-component system nitrate/nitrite response regulator NarL